ncbi:MAG: OmpA family protein [Fibrobacteres bacterium]|nr:OmpA family protein [Fibrobacterota bacterium]
MHLLRSFLFATGSLPALCVASPMQTLEGRLGGGAGLGLQRYSGSFGSQGSAYARFLADYHPTEWLGAKVVCGLGNIDNGDQKPNFTTETFSHLGLDLALQPDLGLGAWRPFVSGGVASIFGTALVDNRSPYDLDWKFYVPIGVGTEFLVSRQWSVWASIESYLVMTEGDRLDGIRRGEGYFETRDELQRLVIGATYRFGSFPLGSTVHQEEAIRALPGDRDGDGIPDPSDRCPNTSGSMFVDSHGCPSDSDRDGIADLLDDCPSTPIGNKVDETGCTISNDRDHDGILDVTDRCPNTSRGASVDAMGCPIAVAAAKIAKPTDSDQDGIPDSRDRCDGTPRGSVVDSTGCVPQPALPPTPPAPPAEPVAVLPAAPPPNATTPPVPPGPPAAIADGSAAAVDEAVVKPKKDTVPAAKPKAMAAAKPEKDSDRDGVPDSRDLCRSSPVGTRVDSVGCSAPADPEADTDQDGVRDIGDQCPRSKYGMKVDATGCQILTMMKGSETILEGVLFQQGTARLLEESLPILEHVARVLKRTTVRVEIAGFTERRGPEGENISLSQRRAEAVKEHLVTLGADGGRLSVRGYGSADPIADNTVEAGRTRNRRIELRVR